jgi:hypothetical protein
MLDSGGAGRHKTVTAAALHLHAVRRSRRLGHPRSYILLARSIDTYGAHLQRCAERGEDLSNTTGEAINQQ